MVTFRDDDIGYARWSHDHPDGYVLHRKGKVFSIHQSQCPHIYELGVDYLLTHAAKICGTESELGTHAFKTSGSRPTRCETCGS